MGLGREIAGDSVSEEQCIRCKSTVHLYERPAGLICWECLRPEDGYAASGPSMNDAVAMEMEAVYGKGGI